MRRKNKFDLPICGQQGFVLIAGLMLLTVLSLLSLSSLQESTLQTLSTGHLQFQTRASLLAESTLIQVERNIQKEPLMQLNQLANHAATQDTQHWFSMHSADPDFSLRYSLDYLMCYTAPSMPSNIYTFTVIVQSEHIRGAKRTIKSVVNTIDSSQASPDISPTSAGCTLLTDDAQAIKVGRIAWVDLY